MHEVRSWRRNPFIRWLAAYAAAASSVRAKLLASASALAAGRRVYVVGTVVGGADLSRQIVIRG
jgi:hypothetical protein